MAWVGGWGLLPSATGLGTAVSSEGELGRRLQSPSHASVRSWHMQMIVGVKISIQCLSDFVWKQLQSSVLDLFWHQ